ncbi:hypothetical protein KBY75_06395 [Cyanobium sp. T1G-Tous]|uniref:ion channel n=1 Tax=Cyanobium sp. T1G-Tous TaxID=2823722 RepID=UPI0020CC2D82|nr:ion channel [Cyanobium sp. T1G-Tous]MCP9803196.1 hypothetical protein [Cyanobium sp. T1G-Tous]
MQSESRKDWIERVKPLIRKPESIKALTSLEPWFQLPRQPIHTAPKRYKQAKLVWIGVVSISLMLSPHVSALLAGAAAAGVLLSNYPTTPQLSRCPEIGSLPGIVLGMFIATTLIHTLVTSLQADLVHSKRLSAWCSTSGGGRHLLIAIGALMTAATLFLEIILWAWVYRHVGAIHGLEASLYFSGITFTTVGYGDITLAKCWQLLSMGEAVNGVLMAGWSTAQLIFLVQRMMILSVQSERIKAD